MRISDAPQGWFAGARGIEGTHSTTSKIQTAQNTNNLPSHRTDFPDQTPPPNVTHFFESTYNVSTDFSTLSGCKPLIPVSFLNPPYCLLCSLSFSPQSDYHLGGQPKLSTAGGYGLPRHVYGI